MQQFFIMLYPIVMILSSFAYLPQIVKLMRADGQEDRISLASWLVWILTASISMGYGIFHLKDVMFCITTGLSLILMSSVVALVLYNRHIRFARVMVAAE